MIFAVPSDFEKVKSIFYSHKKWFPHVRTDYMKRMIAKKQMILEDVYDINVAPEKRKDVITSELYDQVVETLQPDFTDTKSVNDFVMLVNFVNYATKEKFTHFLAHDFGSNGPNTGDYIYVYGTPLEMAKQLQEAGVRFEPLADKNFRGRIGFSDNKHV